MAVEDQRGGNFCLACCTKNKNSENSPGKGEGEGGTKNYPNQKSAFLAYANYICICQNTKSNAGVTKMGSFVDFLILTRRKGIHIYEVPTAKRW